MAQRFFVVGVSLLILTGCATMQKKDNSMVTQLQLRVGELERELSMKDEQIQELNYEVKDLSYDIDNLKAQKTRTRVSREITATTSSGSSLGDSEDIIRVDVGADKIQAALKSAGYYNGKIDNKVGKQTKAAISSFQKDHGLKADGIVGKKTWSELKVFLE